MNSNQLLKEGKLLPVMEEFYSLQGEGFHTGKPAYFLRIGGCDVCCHFCDVKESWNAKTHPATNTDEVIKRILSNPSKAVVITGGEPLQYNLDYLCENLKLNDVQVFLETSGSEKFSGIWNWVCISPKHNAPPLEENYVFANELKVIIEEEADFEWAEWNASKVNKNCLLLMQPEWSLRDSITPKIVDYLLKNPKWNLSLQSHKYIHIQ